MYWQLKEKEIKMASSRRDYICVRESGAVEKYRSQSIGQIIDEKENYQDPFISIMSIGLTSFSTADDDGFEALEWHD